MKRRIVTILLFLIFGALVNIAVAWGCALWSNEWSTFIAYESLDAPPDELSTYVSISTEQAKPLPVVLVRSETSRVIGASKTAVYFCWDPELYPGSTLEFPMVEASYFGLPFRAAGHIACHRLGYELDDCLKWYWGIAVPQWLNPHYARTPSGYVSYWGPDPYRFPLLPIWPGFAINTVFCAAILWLLIPGPFVLRRLIRRKRGHCIKCGYDLRGDIDAGCPECGWGREGDKP